jgi:hypothetical protein
MQNGTIMTKIDGCPLCELKQETEWYFDGDDFAIIECRSCHVPMLVWKDHVAHVPNTTRYYNLAIGLLAYFAEQKFGRYNWEFDYQRRQIPEHWHVHARRKASE